MSAQINSHFESEREREEEKLFFREFVKIAHSRDDFVCENEKKEESPWKTWERKRGGGEAKSMWAERSEQSFRLINFRKYTAQSALDDA